MIYLVSTPIGNLGDITLRALESLRAADVILSEDTRKTGLLLKHFEISKPQLSFHEHNERVCLDRIARLVAEGKSLALVSDAGTPAISDPGFRLVRRAIEDGWEFTAIPGPTAFVMAIVLSGLPIHSFTFRGFPPRKTGARRRFLSADVCSPYTLVYYESPYRLHATLADLLAILGDRDAAIANDLTKYYESVHRGRLTELIAKYESIKPKGEYTLVIRGANPDGQPDCQQSEDLHDCESDADDR